LGAVDYDLYFDQPKHLAIFTHSSLLYTLPTNQKHEACRALCVRGVHNHFKLNEITNLMVMTPSSCLVVQSEKNGRANDIDLNKEELRIKIINHSNDNH
jgi:hypothetical protein